ncbi:hypothetical protein SEPCBS119000_003788 [Sporothrix epigloea]|uniref:Aminoglycoside phosphotransferase domain-containing protein n=1 Tax=Sporothrix epigloea TaxID=1892477 RepID=A0ABP0DQE9_9PEZI
MSPYDKVSVYQYVCSGDDLAHQDNIVAFSSWKKQVLSKTSLRALEAFVGNALHGTATFVKDMRGSYNLVLKFRVTGQAAKTATPEQQQQQQHVVLRLPLHGFYPPVLVAKMLETEVAWLRYFAAHGIAKVPAIYAWSTASDNSIGSPYLLMEFVAGEILNGCLERWSLSQDPRDKERLHAAYEDMATMLLAMYRHRFDKIGALREPADGHWAVTQRPVTHAMRDLLLNAPGTAAADDWPRGPLSTAAEFRALFLQLHRAYQDDLRSINIPGQWQREEDGGPTDFLWALAEADKIDMDTARAKAAGRIVARRGFAHPDCLSHLSSTDTGPFCIFNRDFHPRNMIVDPDTGRIAAVFDLEGTNAMPAAFAEDPPLFLRPFMLFHVIVFGKLPAWQQYYATLLDTFLGIMERLEAQQLHGQKTTPPLSARMRASWESKQWLDHFAMHELDASDYIFWSHLHDKIKTDPDAEQEQAEIDAYQQHTEKQIADYEKDRVSRKRDAKG